jgi:hypothetical protein
MAAMIKTNGRTLAGFLVEVVGGEKEVRSFNWRWADNRDLEFAGGSLIFALRVLFVGLVSLSACAA